ncbi:MULTISPECIES: IS1096 element passenger TnpR family protein [Sphingobacterium]|uniref:Plasmid pRiA4b Orf3-like domain-containing protein n=1 Tax=Sphingobacterium populi TaxID=1812824 RepID=A0ABW5UCV9_9SPHI|nr:hypothetical protein [Sphingobacterium sp. CFCC 11742]
MAIYRFKVTFEDYEDIYREIDMQSKSTFLELHEVIHSTTSYEVGRSSSFYVSNDQWKKGTEIAHLPNERKTKNEVLLMADIKLSKFIDDPHQKFYYVYNFDRPYDFHVELVKILKEEEGKSYPAVFKSIGQAPKNVAAADFPVNDDLEEEDEDFIHEDAEVYGVDEEDDFDAFDDEDEKSEGSENSEKSSSGYSDDY